MPVTHKKRPAIVLGNGLTALNAVQALGRRSVPVYLVGSHKDDIAYHSRYAVNVDQVNVDDANEVALSIQRVSESSEQRPIILCCSDHFLEIISTKRDEIQECCDLVLSSPETVAIVLNKGQFGDFCATNDLPAPRSWKLETEDSLRECAEAAQFPVAVKPAFAHRRQGENFVDHGRDVSMILAQDANELGRIFSKLSAGGANLVAQEYIVGPDSEHYSFLSYRNLDSMELIGIGVRKIRVFPVHAGVGTFGELTDDADLAAEARKVLDALNYKGLSSVCFKRDERNGKLILHEVNGRFPQPHPTTWLCGVNFPYIAYQDACGEEPDVQIASFNHKKWLIARLDILAFRQYRRLRELSTLAWIKSLMQVRVVSEFAPDDLRPFWFFLRRLSKDVWNRLGGGV